MDMAAFSMENEDNASPDLATYMFMLPDVYISKQVFSPKNYGKPDRINPEAGVWCMIKEDSLIRVHALSANCKLEKGEKNLKYLFSSNTFNGVKGRCVFDTRYLKTRESSRSCMHSNIYISISNHLKRFSFPPSSPPSFSFGVRSEIKQWIWLVCQCPHPSGYTSHKN